MKILLIEDDQYTCEILTASLAAHRYAVDAIADGLAGFDLAVRWRYDLILLDFMLPTLNGIEICRRLRIQGCQTPIMMLAVKDSNEDIIAGLDAGADDYVAKSCDFSQLLARVRALLRRSGNVLASPVLSWGLLCFDPASARVTYDQKGIPLRPKEYSLLELFLRHPRRIFSRSAIIDHLWPMDETPVEGSVTSLIKDLRQRLRLAGMETDLIETVYGLGYRLKAAPRDGEAQQLVNQEPVGARRELPAVSIVAVHREDDWQVRERRGRTAIQRITERFKGSLEQRLAILEAAERSLQVGKFSLEQRKATRTEVHKLAGGLGTFGCAEASRIAQAIECLLESQLTQEAQLANQFSQLLRELKHELAVTV